MQTSPILESALTCPHCGYVSVVTMPTDACVYFQECTRCKAVFSPKPGDCCVFCSYGSVKCPPVQEACACCGNSVSRPAH
ncbi:GDCCVxC domain-containing (seleno)protein [Paraburkholderia caffeinitolerans]|uniref:GDCCVxC domain-containing (seleno)protein n=1 Tax=Paraburkholderia caffeinitolerans TaxID=1723730 RepID=UPI001FEAD8D9|nr:GDCCVxC domain-containing (seleno)protein [Paraburkholderia caffeinitolerans]